MTGVGAMDVGREHPNFELNRPIQEELLVYDYGNVDVMRFLMH